MIIPQTFTLNVAKRETIIDRVSRKEAGEQFETPVEKRTYTILPFKTNETNWVGYVLTNDANDGIVRGEVQKELLDLYGDKILETEYMNAIQAELNMSGYELV